MADYDFSSLNDKEFESLTNDILSSHFGQRIERFKPGRDGGVDGRFFSSPNNEILIQCKHWIKSGLASLLRSIDKTEADKVRKLNPSRYIFVTSLELSRANKIKIKNIFAPFIISDDDIFGNEDLNDLLSKFSDIEQKHYKLWITSTNVLQIILNAAIVGRSKFKLEEIIEDSSRYVMTRSHTQAMEKLEDKHSLIITGAPGVGKTSLADQLCQYYVAHGFELCFIENSLNEAEAHFKEERKQVFYFDDFLGRNFLLALNHHQDSQVVNFISRVKKDSKKRFILTSRSNILNQGKYLSDLFVIKKIDRNEYEVSIASLSEYDKAKILYNHIWFGQLNDGYIDEIYKEKRYKKIINHENFNPRLISFITDSHRLEEVNHESYWEYIEETLDSPQGIWKNVFDVQLDELSRHIVVAISIHGRGISEESLKEFYMRLKVSRLCSGSSATFDTIIRVLVGALLNRNVINRNNISYNLFNPSIADYVLSSYLDDIGYLDDLLTCLKTSDAIDNIHSLYVSGGLDKAYCSKLVEKQLLGISKTSSKYVFDKYLLKLLLIASEVISPRGELLQYITILSENAFKDGNDEINYILFEFVNWVIELGIIDEHDLRLAKSLKVWISDDGKDYEDYVSLSKLIVRVEPTGEGDLTNKFKRLLIEYLSYDITSDAIDAGILSGIYNDEEYSSWMLDDFVSERLSEVAVEFKSSEIEEISECCDIDEIIQSNIDSSLQDEEQFELSRDTRITSTSSVDVIDDLFDRG